MAGHTFSVRSMRRSNVFKILLVIITAAFGFLSSRGQVLLDPKYLFEQEPERVALVIGNGNYTSWGTLQGSITDAEKAREAFIRLGFSVEPVVEVKTLHQFQYEVLPAFRKKINPGAFVVFYFSGHGFSHGPHNMLAPTTMPLEVPEEEVLDHAISVDALHEYFASDRPGVLVFLLDACRSIGSFKVTKKDGTNAATKGPAEQRNISVKVNFLVGYATAPGQVAIGSNQSGTLSVFTKAFLDHIELEGQPFGRVFDDLAARVKISTNAKQDPGLYDWSTTDPYFRRSDATIEQHREAWHTALRNGNYDNIHFFSMRYADSRHSAASLLWLGENKERRSAGFTHASPIAIDRAWSSDSEKAVAVVRLGGPFAFQRSIDSTQAESIQTKPGSEIGILDPSSATGNTASFERSLTAIKSHEKIVLTRDLVATFRNEVAGVQTKTIPKFTVMSIADVETFQKNISVSAFLGDTIKSYDLAPYLWSAVAPLQLGFSLKEIVAPPRAGSIADLVDKKTIEGALKELKLAGNNILWVSLASAKSTDPLEIGLRNARLANAEYILKEAGIPGVKITSVSGRDDFTGDGIRIRFFGTK